MFKSKIVYYYDEEFGTFNYSTSHPMKPIRVAITDDLVHHYGLHKYMDSIVKFLFSFEPLGLRLCVRIY